MGISLAVILPFWAKILSCSVAAAAEPMDPANYPAGPTSYLRLAGQMEKHFREGVLAFWFPRCVDRERGGFHPSFLNDGTRGTDDDRMIVFQSRMTWVAAQVVMRCPDLAEAYRPIVAHGAACLDEVMWDNEFGGPFWQVDASGKLRPGEPGRNHPYGIASCIYAAETLRRLGASPPATPRSTPPPTPP